MWIIKRPEFNIIECERCGTVFKPSAWDTLEYGFQRDDVGIGKIFINCPTCEKYCEVTTVSVTDTNVGSK